MSRAHAQGLADLIRNRRINGRWQPFSSTNLGPFRIEYRAELPMDGRYEVTENGAYRRRLYTLEDALLEVHSLAPDLDIDLTLTRAGLMTRQMSISTLSIGPTPSGEDCQQVPYEDRQLARAECTAFIHQLRRVFGEEPEGAYLWIKTERHDFGSYYEVNVGFDPKSLVASTYAHEIEAQTPELWDAEAREELGL